MFRERYRRQVPRAGTVLAMLGACLPAARTRVVAGLANDIPIALTAQSIAAAVITRNGCDFRFV
jgi:hypothetical protein